MTEIPTTFRASFAIGNERRAPVVDLLNESFDDGQAAITAFERGDGAGISRAFRRAARQAAIRELVALAADDVAPAIAFDTVEAKDWVKADAWRSWSRSAPGASSCTASMTAQKCRRTSSASRSRRRWRSAPAITAPRAAACCCSTRC